MRILMLSWEYPPHINGGLGSHVSDLVRAIAKEDIELTLLTPRWRGGAPEERLSDNTVVYRVETPVESPRNYYADAQQTNLTMGQFAHELWETNGGFDLIHAHDWLVSFAALRLKKQYRAPLVATMHATERGRGGGQLLGEMSVAIHGAEWWLTYEAWRVIATSNYMAHEVCRYFELPRDKVSIIPNGVEPARFDALQQQNLSLFRNEWALPDEKTVYYVGRVQYEKGLHLLVEAAQRILSNGERVKFILAGKGTLLAPLRQWVAELGLQDHILLTGFIDDSVRDALYVIADTAVFPSLYEPFGIVALEAMAAKCPVIVSDVGGLGEVVENDLTGIKIPPYNLDVLVSAIEYVLHNPDAAAARAERAYQAICREYGWSLIARDTISLYDGVVRAREWTHWE